MRRIAPLLVLTLLLGLPVAASARRPVVAYQDGAGLMRLYDAETGVDSPGPPLPATLDYGFRRVTLSHDGRFVVYRSGGRVHMADRATGLEQRVPGIGDGSFVTTSNAGRYIAYDEGSNPPTHVYDRDQHKELTELEIGLPQDGTGTKNKLRQPVLSGDGQFLVGTEFGCANDADSDTCLYTFLGGPEALPDIATDDEDPCIDGDGSVVAVTAPDPTEHNLFMLDLGLGEVAFTKPPGSATAVEDERFCYLDGSGGYALYSDADTGTRFLYERGTSSFVALPAAVSGAAGLAGLIDPYVPPAPVGPRKPVVAYLSAGGVVQFWDAATELHLTPIGLTIPDSSGGIGIYRWSVSRDGRFIVFVAADWSLHLFDRETGAERALPGIDAFTIPLDVATRPGNVAVSDTGRIAFDANSNGPVRVYDSAAGTFIPSGLPADNGHARPGLSGDGRFLVSVCKGPAGCAADLGSDDSIYLTDLTTGLDTAFPENPDAATDRDEQNPCVDGDGSVVGFDVALTAPDDRDIQMRDRAAGTWVAFPAGVMDQAANMTDAHDRNCRLDSSGDWVGFDDTDFKFHVYSRQNDGFLLLPPGASTATVASVWLTDQYPPPPPPPDGSGTPLPDGTPPTPDGSVTPLPTAAPVALTLRLGGRAVQRLARRRPAVVVRARCNKACALTARGSAKVRRRAYALRLARARLRAPGTATMRLRLPRRTLAAVRRALRRRQRVIVTVRVTAVDAGGRRVSQRKRVRLSR